MSWSRLWEIYYSTDSSNNDEYWVDQFGLVVEDVDYIWEKYHEEANISSKRDLLILLSFLKKATTLTDLGLRFKLRKNRISQLLSHLLVSLANVIDEVRCFYTQF